MADNAHILNGVPIDKQVMFSNHKGEYKKKVEKRQTALIAKARFIKPFLKKDEKVLLVATGCSPMSALEQMTTGWIIYYVKRSIFIFTDRRIFHVPANSNFTYRNSISQILYSDCAEIKMGWGTLTIKYRNGDKERFYYISSAERKKIKSLAETVQTVGEKSRYGKRTHICPRCGVELENGRYTCPSCRLEFKSKDRAMRISLIYPGGGYFYTGHPLLGIVDAITELVLSVLLLLSIIGTIMGEEASAGGVVFFGIFLAVEKLITVYHSNHFINEFLPVDKEVKPRPAVAEA